MGIYAISDLHLSLSENIEKPMDIFGDVWLNHTENIKKNWESAVTESDTVIIAGDISWALKPEDAAPDLEWIRGLPGRKIIVKGNHDLWWNSIKRLNTEYGPEMSFIQNSFCEAEGYAVCGSRGWICPGDENYTEQDEKIYSRELMRLRSSLTAAKEAGFSKIIGVLHFPPTNDRFQASGFTELFSEFGAKVVLYGHLHGADAFWRGVSGYINGVEYRLISLDYLKCGLYNVVR